MAITPLTFTGISTFSADFQTILNRAMSIAAVPVTQLQSQQTDLIAKKQLTTGLSTAVKSLGDSVAALGKIGANDALSASSSDTAKVTIAGTTAQSPATYTITEITSIARNASKTSAAGFANASTDTVSASGEMDLIVGTKTYHINFTATNNNLAGLRDEINKLNAGVTASVLTTGTGATPNYLSVSATTPGAAALRIVENPGEAGEAEFLTSANQGANTNFKLNGVAVSKASTLINDVVAGLSFNVLAKTGDGESVTLTMKSDRSKLSTALGDLATKYNAVAGLVNAQIGPTAGLLSGDSVIREAQNSLRALVNYQGSGTIRSLAALGIELSRSGEMSFNKDTFDKLSDTNVSAAFEFLGSSTTGLGALEKRFTQISDPVTGLIKLQQDQYDVADKRMTDQIAVLTERIYGMQATMSAKLQLADSLLAQLESQQNMLDASIQSMRYTMFGKEAEY